MTKLAKRILFHNRNYQVCLNFEKIWFSKKGFDKLEVDRVVSQVNN